jgi:hypothetical protein
MIAAQEREQINEPVEFGLGIALDHGFEEAKERLNGVTADQQRLLSHREKTLNVDVLFQPQGEPPAH